MLKARIVETMLSREGDEVGYASQTLTAETQAHLDANVDAVIHMYDKSAQVIQDKQAIAA